MNNLINTKKNRKSDEEIITLAHSLWPKIIQKMREEGNILEYKKIKNYGDIWKLNLAMNQ